MEGTLLLPLPNGVLIDQIEGGETDLVVHVRSTRPTSCCPLCVLSSSSIHSHYRRVLRDVPCGGNQIQLTLTVRTFFCRNPQCQRKIFTERLPTFVEPWARMTARLCSALQSVGPSLQRQPWGKALRTAQHASLSPNDPPADDGSA